MSILKKTVKTVAELNIEANSNLTLSKTLEKGKTLTPVFGPYNTGMINLGNSCYMNSVLQIIFSQSDFQEKYTNNAVEHLNNCKTFTADCFQCQMHKIALGLSSGNHSKPKTRI